MTSDARQAAVQRELAARVLSRRRLLPFIQRLNPKYLAGWVHEDICQRLERFSEAVAAGASPRLMLLMPPRHGKSEIASKNFPAWHMGRYPDHEFIACSYNLSLAMGFSRKVKQLLDDPLYQSVFEGTRLDPNNQSTEEWGVHNRRGGYVAAGIGGPITGKGAHCIAAGTMVSTVRGQIDIEHLYRLNSVPDVLTPMGPRRVLAATRRKTDDLYVLTFSSGKILRATGKHPVYLVGRGAYATVESIYGEAEGSDRLDLRVVCEAVPAAAVRPREIDPAGVAGVLLREGVQPAPPCCEERQAVPDLRAAGRTDADPGGQVLPHGMPPRSGRAACRELPGMRRGVSAEVFKAGLLRQDLRQYGAQQPDDWGRELALPGQQFLRVLVRPDGAADLGERRSVRSVRDAAAPMHAPLGREPAGERPAEPRHAVLDAPHEASQIEFDTISLVTAVRGSQECVYDLQVEDAGCFFAGEILVGNCLVIDDPVKNAEEADSADSREKTWEWYLSTAYSRLAPGGGVLVIQTWWHDDDLAGRLQQMMAEGGEDDNIDQFEVVKYPAIAETDEWLDASSSQILRIEHLTAADDPTQAAARLARAGYDPQVCRLLRMKGEALHPVRYDTDKLLRIKAQNKGGRWWSALYQQNPVPDDGAYFTKDQFRRGAPPSVRSANVFIAFDFAISEKKQNDYTVGTVALQDDDDVLHVADVLRFKSGDAFFIVEAILNLATRWYSPSLTMGFEDGQIWRAIEALLRKRMKERQFYPSITVLKPITDKLARARVIQGRMQQGMVIFSTEGGWYDTVRQEMLRFPAGVHDDCVDSLAWVAQMAVGRMAPRKPKAARNESWKDRLISGPRGSGHMVA